MRVITRKRLKEFWTKHPESEASLVRWFHLARIADWKDFNQARRIFPHADQVRVRSGRTVTVFNLGGNKYRIVTAIHYNTRTLYILRIFTHREYDRQAWREQL